jgi:YidC/Oxa1 family membrane protein insertase
MNNMPRILVWAALALIIGLNYTTWEKDYAPPPGLNTTAQTAGGAPSPGSSADLSSKIPQASAPAAGNTGSGATPTATPPTTASGTVPSTTPATTVPATSSAAAAAAPGTPAADLAASTTAAATAEVVHVHTDVLDLEISTAGGTIKQADLLKYTQVKGEAALVRLENADSPVSTYLLQSGLIGPEKGSYPTHLAVWSAAKTSYDLDGAQDLTVPLTWTNSEGVSVTKTYTFHRGSYSIGLQYTVQNQGATAWQAASYTQFLRNDPRTKSSMFNVESRAFHGPALDDGTKYRKLDLAADSEDSHLSRDVVNGWIAAVQHQFVSAIVPPAGVSYHVTMSLSGDQYLLAATSPTKTVAPGAAATFDQTLYIGPKLQSQLEKISPRLDRVADYGSLTLLAKPLFNALGWVHSVTGNWGLAIILVTIGLKLLFYPLSETSGKSMAKMKVLSPRIKNLQETYKDDREKLGRAMMDLYKKEKVNPATGCLPMIIQIPVFFAFYQVLLESVEMRQAPFALWIQDLSSRDPFFILPAVMAGAMFAQYKVNPPAGDPMQQKVFMFMPLFMSVTFAFFPAGLVLYWVTNTLLSILQQWNINRRIAAADKKKRNN